MSSPTVRANAKVEFSSVVEFDHGPIDHLARKADLELGEPPDALCKLLAATDPKRYERAALRWPQRLIDERLPPLAEVALAASALAELRHGRRAVGLEALKAIVRAA